MCNPTHQAALLEEVGKSVETLCVHGEVDAIGVNPVGRVNVEEATLSGEEIPSKSVHKSSQAHDRSRAEQRAQRDAESLEADDVVVDSQIVREDTLTERLAR